MLYCFMARYGEHSLCIPASGQERQAGRYVGERVCAWFPVKTNFVIVECFDLPNRDETGMFKSDCRRGVGVDSPVKNG